MDRSDSDTRDCYENERSLREWEWEGNAPHAFTQVVRDSVRVRYMTLVCRSNVSYDLVGSAAFHCSLVLHNVELNGSVNIGCISCGFGQKNRVSGEHCDVCLWHGLLKALAVVLLFDDRETQRKQVKLCAQCLSAAFVTFFHMSRLI